MKQKQYACYHNLFIFLHNQPMKTPSKDYLQEKTNLDKYEALKEQQQKKLDQEHYYDRQANLSEEYKSRPPVVLPSGCTIEAVPWTEHNERRLNELFLDC